MKNPAPLIVTVIGLALGFIFLLRKEDKPTVKTDRPQDIIYEMFDAAKAGNIRKYLNCFAPDLRKALDQRRRDQGNAAFREYLKDRSVPVTGIALSNDRFGESSGTVEVEWVHREWKEVQTVTLRRIGGAWRVARLSEARREKLIVPYGTPAYPLRAEEEGTAGSGDQP